jgi:hypothetical protein
MTHVQEAGAYAKSDDQLRCRGRLLVQRAWTYAPAVEVDPYNGSDIEVRGPVVYEYEVVVW